MPVLTLTSTDEVERLVAAIRAAERDAPVVVVATRNGETEPLIDAERLAQKIAPPACPPHPHGTTHLGADRSPT